MSKNVKTDETGNNAGSIADLLALATRNESCAVVFPTSRWSVRDLDERADDYATALASYGVQPGDRVALWIPPSPDLIAAVFGVARVGGVSVPISDRFRAVEIRHVLTKADPVVLLTTDDDQHIDRLSVLAQSLPTSIDAQVVSAGRSGLASPRIVTCGAVTHGGHRSAPVGSRQPVDDVALLMFTSGTSSAPKACVLTHAALITQAHGLAEERYLLRTDSVVWSPLPLFHIAGLVSMLATLSAGARFVHSGVFRAATSLPLIESEGVTHALAAFETIWMQLLDEAATSGTDLTSITVGLSANGEQQIRKLQSRLPDVAFLANYGSTEACGHVAMGRADEPEEVRSLAGGLPLPGHEVRVVAPGTDSRLPAGESGEIQFRGPCRFVGYYNDAEANSASIDPAGWFRSGDLGLLDESGRLYFRGRLKDMLKVGGENVAALEVESYLVTHPAVSIAAVVGAADDHYGEVPAAYVQLAPGVELSEQDLIDYCLGNIATYKVPRYVRFVSEWPMSGTKIRKVDLREMLETELRAAGVTAAPRLHSRAGGAS